MIGSQSRTFSPPARLPDRSRRSLPLERRARSRPGRQQRSSAVRTQVVRKPGSYEPEFPKSAANASKPTQTAAKPLNLNLTLCSTCPSRERTRAAQSAGLTISKDSPWPIRTVPCGRLSTTRPFRDGPLLPPLPKQRQLSPESKDGSRSGQPAELPTARSDADTALRREKWALSRGGGDVPAGPAGVAEARRKVTGRLDSPLLGKAPMPIATAAVDFEEVEREIAARRRTMRA